MNDSRDLIGPRPTDNDLLVSGLNLLRKCLPDTWDLGSPVPEHVDTAAQNTAIVRSPTGEVAQLIIETRQLLEPRDVPRVLEQLSVARADSGRDATVPSVGLVVSRYLTRSTQARLREAGMSYVDATGNFLLRSDSPAVFLSGQGGAKDPWRGPGRSPGNLKGEPAAKIVRTLADFPGPWKARDLTMRSGASTGSVYRVVDFLESEGIATRDQQGLISIRDWEPMLRRWSEDYQFIETNQVTRWIAPRGLEAFLEAVRKSTLGDYAITASVAAESWASYAPLRSAMIYTSTPEAAADEWGLRQTDAGANVLLAHPAYDVVFERSWTRSDGLQIAAPSQVAVDLMTGPGRAPAEAEELVRWMSHNEQLWR